MNYLKYLLLSVILSITVPFIAFSAGIQVSPSKIQLSTGSNDSRTAQIIVMNPTADVQIFEVYADDFANSFTITPKSFTLESGDQKIVEIMLANENSAEGKTLATNISITGKPLARGPDVEIGAGVKIPISVSFVSQKQSSQKQKSLIGLGILASFLIITYGLRRKKL